jgi:CheY-like chemotaxis protein
MMDFGPGFRDPQQWGMEQLALVCVVDDDESVRESLRGLLETVGYAAEAFSSAEDFLASATLARAECLILDVRMPGMSGPELQRELSVRRPGIPLVFITAHGEEKVRARLRAAGAVDCLQKPFTEEALLAAVEAALRSSWLVRTGATSIGVGAQRHACALHSADEGYRVLLPFIQDGFESGQRSFHVVDPKLRDEHRQRLASAGIDVAAAEQSGQFQLRSWDDAYLRDGHFDQDRMLALL